MRLASIPQFIEPHAAPVRFPDLRFWYAGSTAIGSQRDRIDFLDAHSAERNYDRRFGRRLPRPARAAPAPSARKLSMEIRFVRLRPKRRFIHLTDLFA